MKNNPGIFKDKESKCFFVQKQYKGKTIKKRGFSSISEAKSFISNQIYLIDNPIIENAKSDIVLDDLFKKFIEYKSLNTRITTLQGFKFMYKNHISASIGMMRISAIKPETIDKWKLELINKNMTESFSNKVVALLRGIFTYAQSRDYDINSKCLNELTRIKNKKPNQERDILTYEQIDLFLKTFNKEVPQEYDYWLYFYVFSRTGMRPNEFRGLQVKDLKNNYINVNHDITSKITGQGDIIQACKNEYSNRNVLMPPEIMTLLRSHVKRYKQDDFVFGKEKPYRETTLRTTLITHLDIANLPHITLYGFRHSHATHLIRNGTMIKVVSSRLGHKDIQTTLNTYQHLLKEDQESVLKLL